MNTITCSAARAELALTMERVTSNHEPVIITRSKQPPVVMLSLEDYNAMEETAQLLRSPNNARRLLESIQQLESGHGQPRELLEADA